MVPTSSYFFAVFAFSTTNSTNFGIRAPVSRNMLYDIKSSWEDINYSKDYYPGMNGRKTNLDRTSDSRIFLNICRGEIGTDSFSGKRAKTVICHFATNLHVLAVAKIFLYFLLMSTSASEAGFFCRNPSS